MDATPHPWLELARLDETMPTALQTPELAGGADLSVKGRQPNQRDVGFHKLITAAATHRNDDLWLVVAEWFKSHEDDLRKGVLRRFIAECPIPADVLWAQSCMERLSGSMQGRIQTKTAHAAAEANPPGVPETHEVEERGFGGPPPDFFLLPYRRPRTQDGT